MANTVKKPENPKTALRDKIIFPSSEVLSAALKGNYATYEKFMRAVETELNLTPEWRFYNDGKSWLCKVHNGKTTVFWLSVWEGGITKISFHFAEKAAPGVLELDIDREIKEELSRAGLKGRLVSLVLELSEENIGDMLQIARYKKSVK